LLIVVLLFRLAAAACMDIIRGCRLPQRIGFTVVNSLISVRRVNGKMDPCNNPAEQLLAMQQPLLANWRSADAEPQFPCSSSVNASSLHTQEKLKHVVEISLWDPATFHRIMIKERKNANRVLTSEEEAAPWIYRQEEEGEDD
jgi:hypothetical protein